MIKRSSFALLPASDADFLKRLPVRSKQGAWCAPVQVRLGRMYHVLRLVSGFGSAGPLSFCM